MKRIKLVAAAISLCMAVSLFAGCNNTTDESAEVSRIGGGQTKINVDNAELTYKALHLESYARVDFILDENGDPYCLEANTLPGMTPTSLLPQEAKAEGIDYPDLCEKIIEISLERYN